MGCDGLPLRGSPALKFLPLEYDRARSRRSGSMKANAYVDPRLHWPWLTRVRLRILFVLLLLPNSEVFSQDAEAELGTVEAKLIAIQQRSKFTGALRQTDQADPRYVITMELSDSGLESYSIHSPTRLFAGEPVVGRKYRIHRGLRSGRWTLALESPNPAEPSGASAASELRFGKEWPDAEDLKWFADAKGKTESEVLKVYGQPARREILGNKRLRWYYPWTAVAFIEFENGRAISTYYTSGY